MQRLPSDRRVVARFLWIVDGLVAVSGPQLGRIVAVRGRLSAAFDAGDASGQIWAHRGGPHFHRRAADALFVLVFAGVHVSNNDDRVTLPEGGAHAGDEPSPAVHCDEERVPRLPVAVCGAAPRVAGYAELEELLIPDPFAVGFGDNVADHGDRCLEHDLPFIHLRRRARRMSGTSVTAIDRDRGDSAAAAALCTRGPCG